MGRDEGKWCTASNGFISKSVGSLGGPMREISSRGRAQGLVDARQDMYSDRTLSSPRGEFGRSRLFELGSNSRAITWDIDVVVLVLHLVMYCHEYECTPMSVTVCTYFYT
jgi:hypothetical protein